MKVLWFSQTPGGASKYLKLPIIGGGWIISLGEAIKNIDGLELAVCFFHNEINDFKFQFEDITYYPVKDKLVSKVKYVNPRIFGKLWDENLPALLKVIDDFNPDIIHIFGTESGLAEVVFKTKIPVIIHLQGLLNPYLASWLPRNISLQSIFLKSSVRELVARRDLISELSALRKKAKREQQIIKSTKYFFGRTSWDERVVRLFNPNLKYFHCDEILRSLIYDHAGKWQNNNTGILRLVSTINPQIYKGLEIVLQTAEILKKNTLLNFEWSIIGVNKDDRIVKIVEKNKQFCFKNYPIFFKGAMQAEDLIGELLNSNLFIHPSHIDNSPNSVCEAMLLGMPVIAGYVGGIPSLITHESDGLLYNSYDPFDLAGMIFMSSNRQNEMEKIGRKAAVIAGKRHGRTTIFNTIKKTYTDILSEDESK